MELANTLYLINSQMAEPFSYLTCLESELLCSLTVKRKTLLK